MSRPFRQFVEQQIGKAIVEGRLEKASRSSAFPSIPKVACRDAETEAARRMAMALRPDLDQRHGIAVEACRRFMAR